MFNEDLQRELECPICFNYLQIPIRMCKTGHSICDTCRSKLFVCPICESGFSEGSNKSLESIIPLLKFPCKFRDKGCQDLLFHVERLAHEIECPHQGINCPECLFIGSITDMEKHCRDTHRVRDLEQYYCSRRSMFFLETMVESSETGLVQIDGKYFWLRAFKNPENKTGILFSVEIVGTKEEASKYSYKLIFSKEMQKICFEDICKPLGLSNKQLSAPVKTVSLRLRDIVRFVQNEWNISITVENIKLKQNKNIVSMLFLNYTKNKIKLDLYFLFLLLLDMILYYIMFQPNWLFEKSTKLIRYDDILMKYKHKNENYNYFNDFSSLFWKAPVSFVVMYLIEYFIEVTKLIHNVKSELMSFIDRHTYIDIFE